MEGCSLKIICGIPEIKFDVVYADPPWNESGGGKIKRGADRHYALMKTKDIAALDVKSICNDNAHLYLWATNNFLKDAFFVMESWGFSYKTIITWHKNKIGLGQYFRGNSEHCLFGVRGVIPYKILNGKRCQGVTCFNEDKKEHSIKPTTMRNMIEKVSSGNMIELFARQRYPGWYVWGNEVDSDIELH